ncbi:MAG: hypothetical protein ABMB14_12500 [Myxococcota bacterium]
MIAVPLGPVGPRTPAERAARAAALRVAIGPVSGWPEDARAELEERIAILAADGVPEAERNAEELVRAEILGVA